MPFDPNEPRDELGRWTVGGGQMAEAIGTAIPVRIHGSEGAANAIRGAASDLKVRAEQLAEKAKEIAPEFEDKIKQINSILRGEETGINFKRVERIAEKAQKEYAGNVEAVSDPIRSYLVIQKGQYDQAVEGMKAAGAEKVKLQQGEQFMGYRGVLGKFRMSNGIFAEVQANYPEMIWAKELPADAKKLIGEERWNKIAAEKKGLQPGLGHKYYEDFRRYMDKVNNNSLAPTEVAYLKDVKQRSMDYYSNFY